jgi:ketosteroid isomerase-like protein
MLLWLIALDLVTAAPSPEPLSPPAPIIVKTESTSEVKDAQQIDDLVTQQYAAVAAGDINGYLKPFWKSPLLLYITEGAIWKGWDEMRSHLELDYPDWKHVGHPVLERMETSVVAVDTANTLEWWNMTFPNNVKVNGTTTSVWRKMPEGWRIIVTNTNLVEN